MPSCEIKKGIGVLNDRIFALSRNLKIDQAKIIEKEANKRKLINFLTLKNTPVLNKYNFFYKENKLTLIKGGKELIKIEPKDSTLLIEKLMKLESTLKGPVFLLMNKQIPFFDTTNSNNISNTISLINLKSIEDFEKKINHKVEFERFRANFYIEGVDAWDECNWIGKQIKINNISFEVIKNIPRCSATNLQPHSDISDFNLPSLLKKEYGNINMGVYLRPLNDGMINVGEKISLI
tara:strand:- start:20 stop:727 length:708 start_codon:yes stop_codon:yes gene_type:complete